jgi:hypothetical protein
MRRNLITCGVEYRDPVDLMGLSIKHEDQFILVSDGNQ